MSTVRTSSQPPPIDLLFPAGPPDPPSEAGSVPAGRPRPTVTHVHVVPWPDPVIDGTGVDPRSGYVEEFWLGIVGPASVLLVRHLANRFDVEPEGFTLDVAHTARILGLGTGLGRWGPVQRTIHRCVGFGFARRWGDDRLLVRRHLPPVTRQQLARLPDELQAAHDRWRADALVAPRRPGGGGAARRDR